MFNPDDIDQFLRAYSELETTKFVERMMAEHVAAVTQEQKANWNQMRQQRYAQWLRQQGGR